MGMKISEDGKWFTLTLDKEEPEQIDTRLREDLISRIANKADEAFERRVVPGWTFETVLQDSEDGEVRDKDFSMSCWVNYDRMLTIQFPDGHVHKQKIEPGKYVLHMDGCFVNKVGENGSETDIYTLPQGLMWSKSYDFELREDMMGVIIDESFIAGEGEHGWEVLTDEEALRRAHEQLEYVLRDMAQHGPAPPCNPKITAAFRSLCKEGAEAALRVQVRIENRRNS